MACGFEKELLSALADGELSEREKARVQSHVDACAECRLELSDVQAASSILHQVPAAHAPASVLRGVERQIGQEAPAPTGWIMKYRRLLEGAVALAAGVLVVMTVVVFTNDPRPVETAAAPKSPPAVTKIPQAKSDDALKPPVVAEPAAEKAQVAPPAPPSGPENQKHAFTQEPNRMKDSGARALKNQDETAKKALEERKGEFGGKELEKEKLDSHDGKLAQGAGQKNPPAPAKEEMERQGFQDEEKENKFADKTAKAEKKSVPAPMPAPKPAEPPAPGATPPPSDPAKDPAPDLARDRAEESNDVTLLVYSDRLSDARDAIKKEVDKLSKDANYLNAMYTVTLTPANASKLNKALQAQKNLRVVELSVSSELREDLADLSIKAWEDTMGYAKGGDSKREAGRAQESKKPELKTGDAPNAATPAPAPAQMNQPPAAVRGGAQPPKAPDTGKDMEENRPAETPKAKAEPTPSGGAGAGIQKPVTVRILIFPKTYAEGVTEQLRRAESPAEKK
jgi:hypothetical protein